MYVCIYVCTYVLRPNETTNAVYYVLAAVFASCFNVLKILLHEWGHIIYYILAAVFASCFYVLKILLHEWGHIIYYVLAAVFASCFNVLFKSRFVSEGTQEGTLVNPLHNVFFLFMMLITS